MSIDSEPLHSPVRGAALVGASLPQRVRHVLEQLFSLVCDEYSAELERLLDELEQELVRLAQDRSSLLHASYSDTLDHLRRHRAELVPQFLAGLETALAQIRDPPAASAAATTGPQLPVDYSSMRLVEEHEIDEDSALRMISVRHESRVSLGLLLLGQRFGVLAAAPAFDADKLPVGPHGLCRILAAAARSLHINLDARLLLYRLFDRRLSTGYVPLLEAMNLLLVREDVLPGLSYVPLRTRRVTRRPAEESAPAGDAPSPDRHADGRSGRSPAAEAPVRGFTGWPGLADRDQSGGEDQEMFQLLQELLIERRGLVDKLRSRSGPPQPDSLATSDVVAALGVLQTQPVVSRAPRNMPDIRQTLLAQSRQQRGEAAGLSREDSDTFELLGLLYAGIGRELRDDTPSIALLERLQLPLLRVALQDRGFFSRSQHPARQLLNAVAESGARWSGDEPADPQLQQQLSSVVEHLVEQYDGDASVFEAANQLLQQHLTKMARKAEVVERRHVDAARGKDKLELAKRRAREVVEAAIADQRLPRFLQTLLLQAWADALTLVLLRHGEDSELWRQHARATRQIVELNVRGDPPSDELVRVIQDGLGLVGYQDEEAASIVRCLAWTTDSDTTDDPVSRTELAMKLKARARLGADAEAVPPPAAPRTAQEEAFHQQLRSLPFGSWIELVINQQGDVVRRRMAWFSLVTDRVLLVNQRGQRIDEQSLDRIARLMAIDQARIVTPDRARLVDRAWSSALGSLRNLADRGPKAGGET